jgi:3-phenylpropionate/trans-cinnamate dioxygenase ferredoxin reductase component
LAYDALVIATGSVVRELPLLPWGMSRVHYLRTEAHARAIKAGLDTGKRMVVVGAGLIGLEVAASAAELGAHVRLSMWRHASWSVFAINKPPRLSKPSMSVMASRFALSTSLTRATVRHDDHIALETSDGTIHVADLVLVVSA